MKKIILATAALLISFSAFSQCIGTKEMSTCFDNNGNTYQVNRMGNSTYVQGHNSQTGTSWSQQTQTFGNQTTTTGRAANGQTWTQNRTDFGGGNYSVSGRNSQGQNYQQTCNQFGCY